MFNNCCPGLSLSLPLSLSLSIYLSHSLSLSHTLSLSLWPVKRVCAPTSWVRESERERVACTPKQKVWAWSNQGILKVSILCSNPLTNFCAPGACTKRSPFSQSVSQHAWLYYIYCWWLHLTYDSVSIISAIVSKWGGEGAKSQHLLRIKVVKLVKQLWTVPNVIKLFCGRNLQLNLISQSVCPRQAFSA